MSNHKDDQKEYKEFIKQSVESGSFYKDALDWYMFRYVSPVCDRTWLFFITIASAIITYLLSVMIINSFPIVQKVPIIITAKDTTLYRPTITKLRDSKDLQSIEESIIKYLLVRYLKQREEYNFETITTHDLNKKFNIIKNNSTVSEFKRFKSFVSLNNKNSPIKFFGKDVIKKVKIKSFAFKREVNKDFISKAKNFVYVALPTQAIIKYDLTTSNVGKEIMKKYVAKVSFKFSKIDNKDLSEDIRFKVSDYKLFISKK